VCWSDPEGVAFRSAALDVVLKCVTFDPMGTALPSPALLSFTCGALRRAAASHEEIAEDFVPLMVPASWKSLFQSTQLLALLFQVAESQLLDGELDNAKTVCLSALAGTSATDCGLLCLCAQALEILRQLASVRRTVFPGVLSSHR
jgi:hypothetical protein